MRPEATASRAAELLSAAIAEAEAAGLEAPVPWLLVLGLSEVVCFFCGV